MLSSDMSDSGLFGADAEQEDVADSPADEEQDEANEAEDGDEAGDNDADEQDSEGEDGASEEDSEEDKAAPAKPQPKKDKKRPQSKKEDTKYANARKDEMAKRRAAEADAAEKQARMDAFARTQTYQDAYGVIHHYRDFADMERRRLVQGYVDSGVPEHLAAELADMRAQLAAATERAARAEKDAQSAKQYNQLFERFPETREMKELPQEVLDAIDEGETPTHAYLEWKNGQLEQRLRVLEQRKKNAKKGVGSARGAATGTSKKDDFLGGLLG